MAKLSPFAALSQIANAQQQPQAYFDPLDPNADPRTPGDPNAGRLPPGAVPPQAPFQQLMNQMPQSGWSNPNAQSWTQQALQGPYMSGWNPVTGGPAGPATGSGPGQPMTPEQQAAIGQQAANTVKAKRNGLYTGVLSGLATGGPVGAGVALATSAIGNFINTGGWFNSGIDGKWASKTLMEYGYKKGAKGTYVRPDGTRMGARDSVATLMSLIQEHGLTPKKS